MLSIGQTLKQAREDQRITLDKASEVTRIRVAYLQALEADDHSSLPSPVQARGFLRNYVEYLGLNFDQLVADVSVPKNNTDEIIGPMDLVSQPVDQSPNPLSTQEAATHAAPEIDPAPKADALSATTLQPTIRRGRKKAEPEIVDPQPKPIKESAVEPQLNPDENAGRLSSQDDSESAAMPVDDFVALQPPEPDSESTRIFHEIGAELRKRRELLSLHLEEVERNTHVKAHYLEALEKGAMQNLPSTVQTRGMLSNYASFLDLDVDVLLLRYADALQARHREKNPQKPRGRKPGQPIVASLPPLRSFIAGDMIFGIGVAIILIVFSVWGINWVLTIQNNKEIQPTAPSISDVLLATPQGSSVALTTTPLPADIFVEATQTIIIPTQNLNVNVQLNLVAVERTFMRVLVDGKEVFNGRVVPGTAYLYEAENQIEILVGSGAAIRVSYNGRDLGLLGGLGQVVSVIYREDEIITPTAQPTPSPTNTLPATPTLPSTLTPVPSSTLLP